MKPLAKLRTRDAAVSPVIAVILMVAITVVLAATVYVWVSGFGSQGTQPSKAVAFTSANKIGLFGPTASDANAFTDKNLTVASATNGLKWSDLKLTLNGTELDYALRNPARNYWTETGSTDGPRWCVVVANPASGCESTAPTLVKAGQILKVAAHTVAGSELRVLDREANTVITTLVIG